MTKKDFIRQQHSHKFEGSITFYQKKDFQSKFDSCYKGYELFVL